MKEREKRLAALAALAEPIRRGLYVHVASQQGAVSRDAAALALGIPRSTAAFHLDKLAELGLLDVEYRRPPGRGGPGAGRPAKLYSRVSEDVAFSVPERHYDVAASLLAQAVADADERSIPAGRALKAVARDYGRAIGRELEGSGSSSGMPVVDRLVELFATHGYEPNIAGGVITLGNCPFHKLAEEHKDLVCQMNYELIEGLLGVVRSVHSSPRLDPAPGRCCVTVLAS